MSSIILGLIGGLAAILLGALSRLTRRSPQRATGGWKRLRPGWLLHFTLLGCATFVLLTIAFFLGGGSSLPDSASQNFAALLLMLGFGAGGLGLFAFAYMRTIEWNGDEIRVRAPWRDSRHRFSTIVALRDNSDGSEWKIRFADGSRLSVNVYFHGFHEFTDDMIAHMPGRHRP